MRLRSFVFAALFIFTTSCFNRKHERELVQQTWRNYTSAVVNNMGDESVKYLDSATINYYGYVLGLIKTADSITVSKLRFDQKIMVLCIRAGTPKSKIMKMDGRSLFAWSVQSGMCYSNGEPTERLEVLSLTPAKAQAQLIDTSGEAGLQLTFNKEDGLWKLNLTKPLAMMAHGGWDMLVKETGKSEQEVIDFLIRQQCDSVPLNNVWQPL